MPQTPFQSHLSATRDQVIKNGLKSAVCEYVTTYLKFAPDLSSRTRITESLSRDYGKYVIGRGCNSGNEQGGLESGQIAVG